MLYRSSGLASSAALATGLAVALTLLLWQPLRHLQFALHDLALRTSTPAPSDQVVVVTWRQANTDPTRYAALIAWLQRAGARAIAITEPLSPLPDAADNSNAASLAQELTQTQILAKLSQALFAFESALLAGSAPDRPQVNALLRQWRELGLSGTYPPQLERLQALAAPRDNIAATISDLIAAVGGATPVVLVQPRPPAELDADLATAAWAVGAASDTVDADGVVRAEPVGLRHPEAPPAAGPSMSVASAAAALGLSAGDLAPAAGQALRLGPLTLRPGDELRLRAYPRRADAPAFSLHTAEDLLQDQVPAAAFGDRLVVVGEAGAQRRVSLPGWPRLNPATALAHQASALLQGQTVTVVVGGWVLRGLLILGALGAFWGFLAPLATRQALAVGIGAALLLLLTEFYLLAAWSLWLPLTVPAALLALGSLALPATRWLQARQSAGSAPEYLRSTIGRYQIDRELGRGATGIVHLGLDPKIGRRVAIKTLSLPPDLGPQDLAQIKQRFFLEAAAAGRLSHPHIVQIYDAGEDRGLAYIAMEFIEGEDLSRHTRTYTLLPQAQVLAYLADAAEALDYAHAQGVIHRDIKPANLLREDRSGRIKIVDFGIAGVIGAGPTGGGTVLGSPVYMSPEQLAGRALDGRSDLFSLGVTGYQLLTGQLPFQAESLSDLMTCIANTAHVAPSSLRRDLPPALDAVMDRLLHKRPAQRYARGSELAADLRRLH